MKDMKKMLAAVMVFAVAFAGVVVISDEGDATYSLPDCTDVDSVSDITGASAGNYKLDSNTSELTFTGSESIPTGVYVYVESGKTIILTTLGDITIPGGFIFLAGSTLTVSSTTYIGGSAPVKPTDDGSVTVKTNNNSGIDLILDGTVTITNLPWYAKDTITVNEGAVITVSSMSFNGLITNNGTMNLSGTVSLHDSQANLVNNGTITNNGTLQNTSRDNNVALAVGVITNNGILINAGTVPIII